MKVKTPVPCERCGEGSRRCRRCIYARLVVQEVEEDKDHLVFAVVMGIIVGMFLLSAIIGGL